MMQHDKLTDRELKILLATLRCGEDAYAPRIGEKLMEWTGEDLSLGALHSALDRLEERGLVESAMGAPTPERGGRRKKIIRVNAKGQIAVQHALAVLGRMAEGVTGGFGGGEVLV
jgi:DNA-binding PadR family transcriptional regulator